MRYTLRNQQELEVGVPLWRPLGYLPVFGGWGATLEVCWVLRFQVPLLMMYVGLGGEIRLGGSSWTAEWNKCSSG